MSFKIQSARQEVVDIYYVLFSSMPYRVEIKTCPLTKEEKGYLVHDGQGKLVPYSLAFKIKELVLLEVVEPVKVLNDVGSRIECHESEKQESTNQLLDAIQKLTAVVEKLNNQVECGLHIAQGKLFGL